MTDISNLTQKLQGIVSNQREDDLQKQHKESIEREQSHVDAVNQEIAEIERLIKEKLEEINLDASNGKKIDPNSFVEFSIRSLLHKVGNVKSVKVLQSVLDKGFDLSWEDKWYEDNMDRDDFSDPFVHFESDVICHTTKLKNLPSYQAHYVRWNYPEKYKVLIGKTLTQ